MNDFTFDNNAWNEYLYWQEHNIKKARKINDLIKDIQRNGPMKGIGKPEPLKHRPGYSRRIDDCNRLIYDIDELQNIFIKSCKGHYDE